MLFTFGKKRKCLHLKKLNTRKYQQKAGAFLKCPGFDIYDG